MSDVDAVLAAVAGKRASATGWVRGNCPFCELATGRSDRKACLGVHRGRGRYHCFRCSARGRLPGADEQDPFDVPLALEADDRTLVGPPDGFEAIYSSDDPLWDLSFMRSLRYLRGRVSDELAREIGIGYVRRGAVDLGEGRTLFLRDRVVVPVRDTDGAWLGWVARALGEARATYLTAPSMRRETCFFHPGALLVETERPLFVVEGVFDAIHLWPDAVAVLGSVSHAQLDRLAVAPRPVVFLPDGDAWTAGDAHARLLRFRGRRWGTAFVRLPPRKDPDDLPRLELEGLAHAALQAAG